MRQDEANKIIKFRIRCRVGNVGYLIPEAAPGNREIDNVKVQMPTYVPMCPLLGGGGVWHNIDRRIRLSIQHRSAWESLNSSSSTITMISRECYTR